MPALSGFFLARLPAHAPPLLRLLWAVLRVLARGIGVNTTDHTNALAQAIGKSLLILFGYLKLWRSNAALLHA